MNAFIWVLQILLALAFLAAGAVKLIRPRAVLATTTDLAYVEDLSDAAVKTIGALEVLAAAVLLLPAMTGIATGLAPLAAAGLVALMIGGVIVHARRHEPRGSPSTSCCCPSPCWWHGHGMGPTLAHSGRA